jgi:inorganic pyrophosphatase
METLDDIPQQLRDEISHFYGMYKEPEGKVVKVDGWFSREDGLRVIEEARERWRASREAPHPDSQVRE